MMALKNLQLCLCGNQDIFRGIKPVSEWAALYRNMSLELL